MAPEKQAEKKGCMQVVQKIQSCGVSVNYYPTMEQARRLGTAVTIPSAMFAQVADPRKPTQPLEIGHVAVIENKRLARWLASKCHPMYERDTLPDSKPGFLLDVREALKSGFFKDEDELRGIMAGKVKVEAPIPPIPAFEMYSDDRLQNWAADNCVPGYDYRKPRAERISMLAEWVRKSLEDSK